MKVTVLTGIVCASLWIAIKMIFFYVSPIAYDIVPLVLLNMFFLMAAIAIGLYITKRRETDEGNALNDIKNGMTAGVPYALIISVFLYFYYTEIDPEFNAHQLSEAEYALQEKLDNPVEFQKIKDSNADYEVKSKEEIKEQIMEGYRSSYSANSVMTLSLLGLVVMSAMNSIFVTIIYRKVVFRQPKRSEEMLD